MSRQVSKFGIAYSPYPYLGVVDGGSGHPQVTQTWLSHILDRVNFKKIKNSKKKI